MMTGGGESVVQRMETLMAQVPARWPYEGLLRESWDRQYDRIAKGERQRVRGRPFSYATPDSMFHVGKFFFYLNFFFKC
jgi:hypothetical protein